MSTGNEYLADEVRKLREWKHDEVMPMLLALKLQQDALAPLLRETADKVDTLVGEAEYQRRRTDEAHRERSRDFSIAEKLYVLALGAVPAITLILGLSGHLG